MAGGKETPRQKLIGMMYLVLLALLALQMGQEILMKFQQLNQSLGLFVADSGKKNQDIISGIEAAVAKSPSDKYVLDLANQLRAASSKTISEIEVVKDGLIQATGGMQDKDGVTVPAGMKDKDKSSAYLVGKAGQKNGKGYEVKISLDKFVEIANKVEESLAGKLKRKVNPIQSLAFDGKEDPLFKGSTEKKKLDFANLNFDHTEMIASLAFLTERQSRVASLETDLLNQVAALVGATQIKFDKIGANYSAKSEVVASGTDYEATLFVQASSSALAPKMTATAPGGVKVENGIGKIKFKAPPVSEITERTWRGSISIPKPVGGGDTTFTVDVKYKIAPLVIDVQAGAVSALYRNCANPLKINVPALGASYNPAFGVSGGDFVKGKDLGAIVVYPAAAKGTKVTITVSSNGTPVGQKVFDTKPIPLPTVEILTDGKPMPEKTGAVAPGPRSFQVKIKADQAFKDALPTESNYACTSAKITLVSGRRPVGPTQSFGASFDANSLRANCKPGCRYVIEVEGIARKTSRGGSEKVEGLGTIVKTLSITD